ncbi:hypothetical protein [Parapedobacter sp. 10938]|uniref:hypothetical protein n=1 Tax=Parapedobacter flavus TaxID=3110225 RepID=UPI002DBED324|nr:hypothetical protein [Parapedobacter sp. 10938]MEC3878774.1 hypothetical protein [Parapedobacter sp. 10938]
MSVIALLVGSCAKDEAVVDAHPMNGTPLQPHGLPLKASFVMINYIMTMRAFILKLILTGCYSGIILESMAQKEKIQYVMLDMLDSLDKHSKWDKLHRYTLKTEELYGVDETIEMYNFYFGSTLFLFSVLPDFTSDKNWSEVALADIRDVVINDEKELYKAMKAYMTGPNRIKETKTHLFRLVKREGGKYFKSNFCLTEFFYVVHYSSRFNAPYGTLNTGQEPITIKEMKRVFEDGKEFHAPKTLPFPLDLRGEVDNRSLDNPPDTYLDHWWVVERQYLSREREINGEKAYQFWSFTDWRGSDNLKLHRGIDRFIFMPDKGIVAGSYDFWFLFFDTWNNPPIERRKRNNKTKEELWQNVLEEKVMLAEELK